MWTWFEGWHKSSAGRWSRFLAGGRPTFVDAHEPAAWLSWAERSSTWDNLAPFDWRAEWHWTPETKWVRARAEYRPGLVV